MANRFQLNHGGMRAMLNSPAVRAELTRRAEAIAADARNRAPVNTGAYRASIHVEQGTSDRARVLVVADDPKASVIEARRRTLGSSLGAGRSA